MNKTALTLLTVTALSLSAFADPTKFDFKDPKGVNNASFKLDAPLEAISGSANGITGTVTYDPANPATTTGTITIATESLHVGNPMMQGHLLSDKWMDAKKNPTIVFDAIKLENVKTDGDTTSATAAGSLTVKGVTKPMSIPVKLTYLKGKLGQRVPNMKGDLLVVRSQFTIKRSEFNINPGQFEDKVSDEIQLSIAVAGYTLTP